MKIQFPFGNGAIESALIVLVGADGAKAAIDASRSAYGNAMASEQRDASKDTSRASVNIMAANKTRGETAKLRFTQTLLAETASNPPLRLWRIAEIQETLCKVGLAFETVTLPKNLEYWVKTTFSPKPEANGNGNGHTPKRNVKPVIPVVA